MRSFDTARAAQVGQGARHAERAVHPSRTEPQASSLTHEQIEGLWGRLDRVGQHPRRKPPVPRARKSKTLLARALSAHGGLQCRELEGWWKCTSTEPNAISSPGITGIDPRISTRLT